MSEPELRPARYEQPPSGGRFRPKLPWALLLLAGAAIVGGVYLHLYREAQRVEVVRAEIHQQFREKVQPVAPELRGFSERIEGWVIEAAKVSDGDSWAKPGFAIDSLHGLRGVYLRIHESDAQQAETIRSSAMSMRPDGIGRCLGIAPIPLRGFYERSAFLHDGMLAEVETANDLMRMRVIRDQLGRNLDRNIPLLLDMAQSDYFLLAIQRGGTRHQDPMDFYLWDMRAPEGELLLRTRARARGVLLSARIATPGAPRTPPPTLSPRTTGAQDCSLAAQIRATTGETPIEAAAPPEPAGVPSAEAEPAAASAAEPSAVEEP